MFFRTCGANIYIYMFNTQRQLPTGSLWLLSTGMSPICCLLLLEWAGDVRARHRHSYSISTVGMYHLSLSIFLLHVWVSGTLIIVIFYCQCMHAMQLFSMYLLTSAATHGTIQLLIPWTIGQSYKDIIFVMLLCLIWLLQLHLLFILQLSSCMYIGW